MIGDIMKKKLRNLSTTIKRMIPTIHSQILLQILLDEIDALVNNEVANPGAVMNRPSNDSLKTEDM